MTKYHIYMEVEERLPTCFPRFNYYCAYEEEDE